MRGEWAAIGVTLRHAQGEVLQVLQDVHMRDDMRSEMTSAESQYPAQECLAQDPAPVHLVPDPASAHLVPYSTPAHLVQHGREHRH